MSMAWKCAECYHANMGDGACYWCNSTNRVPLFPVYTPNLQQGTPSYDDLVRVIELEEANRFTEVGVDLQIQELIQQFYRETARK